MCITDKDLARKNVTEFIENDQFKSIYLHGVYDEGKLNTIFYCLKKKKYFSGNVVTNGSIRGMPSIFQDAGFKSVPKTMRWGLTSKIGNFSIMPIKMDKSFKLAGEDFSVLVIHPSTKPNKDVGYFRKQVLESQSKKVFIITINDEIFDYDWLVDVVDTSYQYDAKNDDPKTYIRYKQAQNVNY